MIISLDEEKRYHSGIYKFYINEDYLNQIKRNLGLTNLLSNNLIDATIYNSNFYYCAYVDETTCEDDFFGRVVRNHLKGSARNSILRKRLLRYLKPDEVALSKILKDRKQCLFAIFPFDEKSLKQNEEDNKSQNYKLKKKVKKLEDKMINSSIHILNFSNNDFYKKLNKTKKVNCKSKIN